METPDQIVDKVLVMLQKNKFSKWYGSGGEFDKWIRSETYAPTDQNIRDQLKSLLGL